MGYTKSGSREHLERVQARHQVREPHHAVSLPVRRSPRQPESHSYHAAHGSSFRSAPAQDVIPTHLDKKWSKPPPLWNMLDLDLGTGHGYLRLFAYSYGNSPKFIVFDDYADFLRVDRVWNMMVTSGHAGNYTHRELEKCAEAAAEGHLAEQVIMYIYRKRKVLERLRS